MIKTRTWLPALLLLAAPPGGYGQDAPPKVEMTEELMARLINYTRNVTKSGSVGKDISKALDLNDGTQDLPLKLTISDSKDGKHYLGLRLEAGSKDILLMVVRDSTLEAYLTDRTCKLRAAAVSTGGTARLITNEKALDKFNAELALFAKESAEQLPPTASGSRHQQWRGEAEGDLNYATRALLTNDAWAGLWAQLKRPVPRTLDDHEMAVFIAVGERPTGGFYPLVHSATELGQQYVVVYADGKPAADAVVSQGQTRPWVLAIVPKSALPVIAREQAAR